MPSLNSIVVSIKNGNLETGQQQDLDHKVVDGSDIMHSIGTPPPLQKATGVEQVHKQFNQTLRNTLQQSKALFFTTNAMSWGGSACAWLNCSYLRSLT